MSFRVATCNAHAPGNAAANKRTIETAAAKCDVLLVQEADSQVIAALRGLKGWTVVLPGGLGNRNPIAYRTGMFRSAGDAGWRRIYENKPNVADGPDRSMTWKPLQEVATDLEFCVSSVHMIHQALTSHPERLPGWLSSLDVVGPTLETLRQRHDRVICGGDWNNPKVWNIPGVLEQEVASAPTFGKRRYDRIYLVGDVTAGKSSKVATPSDHDTLVVPVTLRGAQATPKPTPKPKPAPAPKPQPKPEAAMKFVSRAQWGARRRGATKSSHPIGATKGVTLHWEGPHMGSFPHSQCAAKIRGIEKFHRDGRGWADIAYNAIVCPHGYVFEGRGAGVKSAANGNSQDNDDWYAVCYLGGQRDPFTDDGKQGMDDAVVWLRDEGNAGPAVNGHRDHKPTECPGNEIHKWLHGRQFGARTTPEKDWFDMATEADLRRIVREEVNKAIGDVGEDVAKELLPGMDDAPKGRWLGSAISNIHNAVLRIEKKVEEKR